MHRFGTIHHLKISLGAFLMGCEASSDKLALQTTSSWSAIFCDTGTVHVNSIVLEVEREWLSMWENSVQTMCMNSKIELRIFWTVWM